MSLRMLLTWVVKLNEEPTTMKATHVDPAHYSFAVAWSPEDGEFVATCAEMPSLSSLDKDPDAALARLQRMIADIVIDVRANGDHVPEPPADQ